MMRKIITLLTMAFLVLVLPACSGTGFGLDGSIITGGGSLGQDGGEGDFEDDESDDIEDIDLSEDADAIITDTEIALDTEIDSDTDTEIVLDTEIAEIDDSAIGTDDIVTQDTEGVNAAASDSEVGRSADDDEFDSSTGPVALPATPPKEDTSTIIEGDSCDAEQSGEVTLISYSYDGETDNLMKLGGRNFTLTSIARQVRLTSVVGYGNIRSIKINAVGDALESHLAMTMTCEINELSGEFEWHRFDPSLENLAVVAITGTNDAKVIDDSADENDREIFVFPKRISSGLFRLKGKYLPKGARTISFKLYDRTTGKIL